METIQHAILLRARFLVFLAFLALFLAFFCLLKSVKIAFLHFLVKKMGGGQMSDNQRIAIIFRIYLVGMLLNRNFVNQ